MSRKKIILVGAGQLGVLVSNILKKDKKYSIAGFVDTKKKLGKTVNGIKIIGGDDYLKKLPPKKFSLIICIGDVLKRKKLYQLSVKCDYLNHYFLLHASAMKHHKPIIIKIYGMKLQLSSGMG